MKKIALACVLGMVLCGQSAADEMFGGATRDWSGSYFGLQGGGAWGDVDFGSSGTTFDTADLSGAFGGWTSGYNWQSGAWVWGIESDTSFADISGSACLGSCVAEVNWFSSVRGRLGYSTGMFLFYGTVGIAYGEIESGFVGIGPNTVLDDINVGLAVGGGVEMAFDENWSAKIEYLHIDLGDNATPFMASPLDADFSDINIVRVGVNRKFDLWGMLTGK